MFGAELGIFYGKKLTDRLYLETGFNIDLYGRSNNPIKNEYKSPFDTIPKTRIVDGSYLRFAAHIPILLNYITSVNNLRLNTGLLLSGRNLLTFTDYSGFDPEVRQYGLKDYPRSRRFGIEWLIGADYRIIGPLLFSLNFRTSLNSYFFYDGLLVMELKYNIFERKK